MLSRVTRTGFRDMSRVRARPVGSDRTKEALVHVGSGRRAVATLVALAVLGSTGSYFAGSAIAGDIRRDERGAGGTGTTGPAVSSGLTCGAPADATP
jgi:hypothetical protein